MDFTIPEPGQELTRRVRHFIDAEVIPLEKRAYEHQNSLPPACGRLSCQRKWAD